MSVKDLDELRDARYVGLEYPMMAPDGTRVPQHVVEVAHTHGPWRAIYCNTEAQARAIVSVAEQARLLYDAARLVMRLHGVRPEHGHCVDCPCAWCGLARLLSPPAVSSDPR